MPKSGLLQTDDEDKDDLQDKKRFIQFSNGLVFINSLLNVKNIV